MDQRRTEITYGPLTKLAITTVLVVPIVCSLYALSHAWKQPLFAAFSVPLGCCGIMAFVLLPELWEKGRR